MSVQTVKFGRHRMWGLYHTHWGGGGGPLVCVGGGGFPDLHSNAPVGVIRGVSVRITLEERPTPA